jgi:hypothetical protein
MAAVGSRRIVIADAVKQSSAGMALDCRCGFTESLDHCCGTFVIRFRLFARAAIAGSPRSLRSLAMTVSSADGGSVVDGPSDG